METKTTMFMAIGLLIAVSGVLLAVSLRLWRGLQRHDVAREQDELQRRDHLLRSVGLLAQTTVAGELSLAEGAIRSKMLLDHLVPNENERGPYRAIYALHDATEHLSRREQRDELTAGERQQQDAEREQLEAQHRDGVIAEMRGILQSAFA